MINKIIKVSAPWCGPCRQLKLELENFTEVPIEELDAEENEEFCEKYSVRNIPTLLFFDESNNLVYTNAGFVTKDWLSNKIKELNGD